MRWDQREEANSLQRQEGTFLLEDPSRWSSHRQLLVTVKPGDRVRWQGVEGQIQNKEMPPKREILGIMEQSLRLLTSYRPGH